MQVLAIIFAIIGIVSFFALGANGGFLLGLSALLSMLAIACVLYALGEISSDIRDINNILRKVYAEKLSEKDEDNNKLEFTICPKCGHEHYADSPCCPNCKHSY